jgi:peptidoglycan glycosyltransferase
MTRTVRTLCGIVAVLAVAVGLFYQPEKTVAERSDNIWLICLGVTGIMLLGAFWVGRLPVSQEASQEDRLRHNVQRISSLLVVGFILLSLQLLRQQVVVADELQKPFFTPSDELVQDPRLIREKLSNQRGKIRDTYGNVVAGREVNPQSGLVKRTYGNPTINQIIGYYSPLQFGNSGLEAEYDDYLTGKAGANALLNWQRDLLHQPVVGNDLYLTIEPNLQSVAQQQMGNLPGAIVLMDAKSGAVLAMVGNPHFDPSALAFDPTVDDSKWPEQTKAIQQRWNQLNNDPTKPLLIRPTQGLYTPGSTFKTITLAAALDLGLTQPNSTWTDTGSFTVEGATFKDPNRPDANRTTWTSREGYMFSLNSVFAQMGLQVGGDNLIRYMNNFGFNQPVPFDMAVAKSLPFVTPGFLTGKSAQASTGFGQGEILATPLEMALVAATMGRQDGTMPKPYLVKEIRTPEGGVIKQTQPEVWLRPVKPETARTVHDIMIASATDGWVGLNGGALKDTGATVGGKTGTAEVGGGVQNAWYIAWASKGDRLFAIAVVVDHQPAGEGLRLAMPRANVVLREVLKTVK